MNKYLKLTLIFAAIIGVIVVLGLFSGKNIDPDLDPEPIDTKYSQISDWINKNWEKSSQWDKELYKTSMDTINDYYRGNYIEEREYHLLFELVNSNAVVAIGDFFDSEMKKAECNDSVIEKNKAGLDFISEYENPHKEKYDFSTDERVVKAKNMYEQYKDIIAFCEKDFDVTAKLNGECEWVPFIKYNEEWNSQKGSLEKGKYYTSHFYNINKVKDAWSSYDSKVQQSKDNYYNELAGEIKNYFDQRYKSEEWGKNQQVLINSGIEINKINEELIKQQYSKVKVAYETIEKSYNNIKKKISLFDREISDFRQGSNKYYEKLREKADYVNDVKKDNQHNKEIKTNTDSLIKEFEENKKQMEALKKSIGEYQGKLDEYSDKLEDVNKKFKDESSFDALDHYCEEKETKIRRMSNDLPMVNENKNDRYISYLNTCSEELKNIIEYIENL